ncbi:hypothetical protein KUTeg_001657 [Tegillarca granosa]|uniref:Mutator-like transposase domain-containing protein n=1 Tax=Tegillarca granosa TaxID=220873 RepID=A0ABQ9FWE7_TEGGR|nr:hypothetical protein KUTeg_001657 [Tegillarca granosa]
MYDGPYQSFEFRKGVTGLSGVNMANKSKRKSSKPFGLAGGKHGFKRKIIYQHHKQKYKSTVSHNSKRNVLKIYRNKFLDQTRRYRIKFYRTNLKHLFVDSETTPLYNMKKTSLDSPLKFKIKRCTSDSEGYRLVNLNILQTFITNITLHCIHCEKLHLIFGKNFSQSRMPPITLVKELKTNGLASVLLSQCEGCKDTFRFETSPTLPLDNSQHYDVNVRSVWGSMVTGGGVSHLNELMATLNSPGMSQPTYSNIEQEIGDL